MRTAYRSDLDEFAQDLIAMCDTVREAMAKASSSLLSASLQEAEDALSMMDPLEEIRQRCKERSVQLLALEAPVASDLRQVISSIYIVEDFDRMAALSMHIAKSARRRHPDLVIPEEFLEEFSRMASLVDAMCGKARELLVNPDADVALGLATDDDQVDILNDELLSRLTRRNDEFPTRQAVDTALLLRFYERWADHCVNVSSRIVFLITGFMPDQYAMSRIAPDPEEGIKRRYEDQRKRGNGQLW